MFNRSLVSVEINAEFFELILKNLEQFVVEVDDLTEYKCGYFDKSIIYVNKTNTELICLAKELMYIDDSRTAEVVEALGGKNNYWKQIVCRRRNEQEVSIEKDFTGANCVIYMNKLLSDYYTKEQIENILYAHEAEYDEDKKQRHNAYDHEAYKVIKYENCVKYDIHKAHLDALIEMFPKAKQRLLQLAEKAKVDKKYKKIANYYVGMLAHAKQGEVVAKHRKTYNWIVQRVTEKVDKRTEELVDIWSSEIVYMNTDSICVSNPKQIVEDSNEIGEFGIEYQGTVYSYRDSNYIIYQFGDDIKGNLPLKLRHLVNLKEGKIVKFDRVKIDKHYEYINIESEIVNVSN